MRTTEGVEAWLREDIVNPALWTVLHITLMDDYALAQAETITEQMAAYGVDADTTLAKLTELAELGFLDAEILAAGGVWSEQYAADIAEPVRHNPEKKALIRRRPTPDEVKNGKADPERKHWAKKPEQEKRETTQEKQPASYIDSLVTTYGYPTIAELQADALRKMQAEEMQDADALADAFEAELAAEKRASGPVILYEDGDNAVAVPTAAQAEELKKIHGDGLDDACNGFIRYYKKGGFVNQMLRPDSQEWDGKGVFERLAAWNRRQRTNGNTQTMQTIQEQQTTQRQQEIQPGPQNEFCRQSGRQEYDFDALERRAFERQRAGRQIVNFPGLPEAAAM